MHKVIILGSTGSLGSQTLEILQKYPEEFELIGLFANKSAEKLVSQSLSCPGAKTALATLGQTLDLQEADIVVNVLPGLSGIEPSLKTLALGKSLLLGNKESLVAEGQKIMRLLADNPGAGLIPLDSEHNAIYEILKFIAKASPGEKIDSITLPCSGGPLLKHLELENITPAQALKHPKWSMGPKVSLESATLINKGLEIIEAHYLFDLPLAKIKAKIHPECQIHGLVTTENGNTYAYYASPDMREHIENALLRTLDKEPPLRKIRLFNADEYSLQDLPPQLPGIELVLANFQKSPQKMAAFLEKEERVLQDFLDQKIPFLQIFEELKP